MMDDNSADKNVAVLFVCLGNICRSPSSEGIFRHLVTKENLNLNIHIDSAGTASYHVGHPPDQRATAAAAKRDVDITNLRARQTEPADFYEFDYIIAMDRMNYEDLKYMAPTDYGGEIRLFMEFTHNWQEQEVPDPYYGGGGGFERVLDMIEDAAAGLLEQIKKSRGLT